MPSLRKVTTINGLYSPDDLKELIKKHVKEAYDVTIELSDITFSVGGGRLDESWKNYSGGTIPEIPIVSPVVFSGAIINKEN